MADTKVPVKKEVFPDQQIRWLTDPKNVQAEGALNVFKQAIPVSVRSKLTEKKIKERFESYKSQSKELKTVQERAACLARILGAANDKADSKMPDNLPNPLKKQVEMSEHLDRMFPLDEQRERAAAGHSYVDLKTSDKTGKFALNDKSQISFACHDVKGFDKPVHVYLVNSGNEQQLPIISDAELTERQLKNVYKVVSEAPPQLFKHLLTKNFSSDSPAIYVKQDLGPLGQYRTFYSYFRINNSILENETNTEFVLLHEGMHHCDSNNGGLSDSPDGPFRERQDKKYSSDLKKSDYVSRYAMTGHKPEDAFLEDFAETGQYFLRAIRGYLENKGQTMADLPKLQEREIKKYFQNKVSSTILNKILFIFREVFQEKR